MNVPLEVAVTTVAFYALWVVAVGAVFVMARREAPMFVPALAGGPALEPHANRWTEWNHRLWAQWQPAAILAALYLLGSVVRGGVNPLALGVFCQALVGLAIARSIPGFVALPVVSAVREHRHAIRAVLLMLVLGVVANLVANVAGSLGLSAGSIFGEKNYTREAASSFPYNPFQAFFVLLAGAGIAEEVMFRLLGVTIVWKLTGHAWMGIAAGALLFALYHFTPLDGLYQTFWRFPVSAFLSNVLVGSVWGIVYVKRGLETAIAGHTPLDWVTVVFFVH